MSDVLSKEEVLKKQIDASCQVLRDAEIFETIFTIMRCAAVWRIRAWGSGHRVF